MPAAIPAAAPAGPDVTAVTMLEALSAALSGTGFRSTLVTRPGRPPALHVMNPAAVQLSEDVCAAPRDGTWYFWWPWADPIATGVPEAAARIREVLRAGSAGPAAT